MPTQTLTWTNFGGSGSQAADFTGVNHNTGLMTVRATLIEDGVTGPNDIFSSAIDSGEVRTDGNYSGGTSNSALELDNAGGTGSGSSPGGDSNSVSLRLDFDTNNAANYGDGAQNVSFWISDIDRDAWRDQINVRAYDINGNPVSVNVQNIGSNVSYNAATGDITANNNAGNLNPTDASGAVQIVIPGPIAYLIIDYDNLDTGDQRVEVGNISFETIPPDYPWCFVAGTLIATPNGDVPIESLKAGDLVLTQDHGPQPLRWIGSRSVAAKGEFAPVCFAPGVLGNTETLKVSGAHRVLVSDARVELLFEQAEVLVAARSLLDGDRVYRAEGGEVTYYHMLFDQHELVWSNGAISESFHPIENSLGSVDRESRAELLALFPELFGIGSQFGPAARPTLSSAEARVLVA